jgi:hypothetical protein
MQFPWLVMLSSSLSAALLLPAPRLAVSPPGSIVPLPLIPVVEAQAMAMFSTVEPGVAKGAPEHPAVPPSEDKEFAFVVELPEDSH